MSIRLKIHKGEDFCVWSALQLKSALLYRFPLTSYSIKKATFDIIEAKNQYIL